MTTPTPKRVFVVIPRPRGRGMLLEHIIRHGIAAPGQPTPRPETPGDTHTDPPRISKQDPR